MGLEKKHQTSEMPMSQGTEKLTLFQISYDSLEK